MPRLLATVLLLLATPVAAATVEVPVLAYHEVAADPQRGWAVRTDDFRQQMEILSAAGYHVVPIEELIAFIDGQRETLPPHPVVITVDDGWQSEYTDIDPILREFGYPYSIYLYPAIIGHGADYMTWPEVEELVRRGVDVESHTMTHPHLMHRSHPEMSDADYGRWLHDELASSKALLAQKTGRPVSVLSYPYGDYDAAVEEEARRDDYRAALTSTRGLNVRTTDPLALFRVLIESDTTLAQFLSGLGAEPLRLEEQIPFPGSVSPDAQTASAIIASPVDPASVHMVLLGDASARFHFDPNEKRATLTFRRAAATSPAQIVVWGDDEQGNRLAATWTFYPSEEEKQRAAAIREKMLDLPLHHTQTHRR